MNDMAQQNDMPIDDSELEQLDQDPTLQDALAVVMKGLYEGGAAKEVAASLKSAPDPVQGLMDTSYKMIQIADEAVDGVDDEVLALFAILTMQEVAEIGEAAGVKYTGSQLAEAYRQMIVRFLQDNGYDSSELEAAMAQVDQSAFDKEVS